MDPWIYIRRAAAAAARQRADRRAFAVGALALRADGAITASRNESSRLRDPTAHAERRVVRKVDYGAIVFVARVRHDGRLGLARPCHRCLIVLRNHRVRRCYFSINDSTFGVIEFAPG